MRTPAIKNIARTALVVHKSSELSCLIAHCCKSAVELYRQVDRGRSVISIGQ